MLPHLGALVAQAQTAGITGFLVPGVTPEGWQAITGICGAFPRIFPAFGVHPLHAHLLTSQALSELRQLCRHATAIGEIGLDYSLAAPAKQIQKDAFCAQLALAAETKLPVLIHCRKAFGDLLEILRGTKLEQFGGVMHAFSGSLETAHACLRLGLHISIAGSVTYENARRPLAVAAQVPMERLLLETDAPDMAPEPFRGKVNQPSYLLATAHRVAQIRGVPLEELARATSANASRLFRLDAQSKSH